MHRPWLMIGSLMGFLAVIAGTFAAHGLDQRLSPQMLEVFQTGARYHMYHALAILFAAVIHGQNTTRLPAVAAGFFLTGIVLFSGSLYLLAVTQVRWLGMIAPVGGTAFLMGWATLGMTSFRKKPT